MNTQKNILIAFVLNLLFSVFEFFGGIITGSVAIISDAVHDIGDAVSIGICYLFEKKSNQPPNEKYTYGYARYSVIGGLLTTIILIIGSVTVIYNSLRRIFIPSRIDCDGMIVFAIIGICVNFFATLITHRGNSVNQKAVNLHMLEDLLGWLVTLVGAIVIKFTEFTLIDPIMSVLISTFILINAFKNIKYGIDIILEKVPENINTDVIKEEISKIDGVIEIHTIRILSIDGTTNYATIHITADSTKQGIKNNVRKLLADKGIAYVTIEIEN